MSKKKGEGCEYLENVKWIYNPNGKKYENEPKIIFEYFDEKCDTKLTQIIELSRENNSGVIEKLRINKNHRLKYDNEIMEIGIGEQHLEKKSKNFEVKYGTLYLEWNDESKELQEA